MSERDHLTQHGERTPERTSTIAMGQTTERPALRVAAYLRYSSRMQRDGYSLAAQRAEIEREALAWTARTGQTWDITWHIEPERSARAEKITARLVFRQMLESAKRGEVEMVVVHKLDRFARSLRHQLQFIHELAQSGVAFYSVVEKPDFSSPQGRLVANMFGVLAQFQSDNLGQEVKKGLYQRAQSGLSWGPPPFGYVTKHAGHAGDATAAAAGSADVPVDPDAAVGAPIPDPATWEGYQTIKRLILAGENDTRIAAWLNADGRWSPVPIRAGPARLHGAATAQTGAGAAGGYSRARRPWTFWGIRKIRTNEFYRPFAPGDTRGTVHVRSERYRGQHLAACTWDEWQTMQTINHLTYARTGDAARYAIGEFIGLASCASCGERLYALRSYRRDRATNEVLAVYERLECPSDRWAVDCPSAAGVVRAQDLSAAWTLWLADHFPAQAFPPDWERGVTQQMGVILAQRMGGSAGSGAGGTGDEQTAHTQRASERVDRKRLLSELQRWHERRQAAIDARLDGWIDAAEARTRVADADREVARIQAQLAGLADPARADRELAHLIATLRTGHQVATWATIWPQMTREERQRAARLMIEPEGLRVNVPAKGKRGRHNHATAGIPDEEVLRTLIVEVRLRPDCAHALDLIVSLAAAVQQMAT